MYLLDTNVAVHYLNKSLPQKSIEFLNNFIDYYCYISVISQMEAMGFNFKNRADKIIIEIFMENSIILNINSDVVQQTIAISKSKK